MESRPEYAKFYDMVNLYEHPSCAISTSTPRSPGDLECPKKYGFQPAPDDMPLEGIVRQWQAYSIVKCKTMVAPHEPGLERAMKTMNASNASMQFFFNVMAFII